MEKVNSFLTDKLNQRKNNNNLRSLSPENNLIDFCSNDYLGFAKSGELKELFLDFLNGAQFKLGSTGSRLLTGNTKFTEELEQEIAAFHGAEAGLIYNSGFDACLGLLANLPQKGETVITDELIHACIIDGCRLNYANRYIFKHNNIKSLEEKLQVATGNIYVVIESVYSMDGDLAPLTEIYNLCKEYEANLIVDEAHATGVFGENGNGLVCQNNLQNLVFARIVTFGKALGGHGAIVLGSKLLRSYLINFSRSFIYTTAPAFSSLLASKLAYGFLNKTDQIEVLKANIQLFKRLSTNLKFKIIDSKSAIQCVIIGDNKQCKVAATFLQTQGFDVRAILSPTVKEGTERLRICLHAFNTDKEIENLVKAIGLIS